MRTAIIDEVGFFAQQISSLLREKEENGPRTTATDDGHTWMKTKELLMAARAERNGRRFRRLTGEASGWNLLMSCTVGGHADGGEMRDGLAARAVAALPTALQ
ncbi:hypothetical protein TcBrA4_0094320 [Trypanosoma cruzi]|nr:hypothetical protein TcBrA4_0094320 [Trypanosoma cruzi]